MDKTNKLKREIEEYLTKDYCCEFKEECKDGIRIRCSEYEAKLYLILRFAEPREKRIEELEMTISKMEKGTCDICKETEKDKKIADLEKENAELKKNYEDSLVACGVLKEKIDLLSEPSPIEAMQDVLITAQKEANKKQNDQLTKAKELLKQWLQTSKASGCDNINIVTDTEQFLKDSEVKELEKSSDKWKNLYNSTNEQLTEAKEIIKDLLNLPFASNEEVFADVSSHLDRAEQFLKE